MRSKRESSLNHLNANRPNRQGNRQRQRPSRASVSYTHLDVYKRQQYNSLFYICFSFFLIFAIDYFIEIGIFDFDCCYIYLLN